MKHLKLFFIVGTIIVMGVVWVRLEKIRMGYVYQTLKKSKKNKLEEFYKVKLIYAETVSPIKMEIKAKGLGLIKPREEQFRYIKPIGE